MQKLLAERHRQMASWCLGLLLTAGFSMLVWSQEVKPSARPKLPEGILLKPAPEFSQWTVTFSYPQDQPSSGATHAAPPSPDLIRKIAVTKTGKIIHEEFVNVSGDKLDKWQAGDKYYSKSKGQSFWGAYDAESLKNTLTSDIKILPLPASGFRDLDWVSGETYAGSIKEHGNEYLLFVPANAASVNPSDASGLKTQPIVAYVDAVTRLPVALKNRNAVQRYTFAAAPTEMQSLPPDLVEEIKEGDEKRAKVFATPHSEY